MRGDVTEKLLLRTFSRSSVYLESALSTTLVVSIDLSCCFQIINHRRESVAKFCISRSAETDRSEPEIQQTENKCRGWSRKCEFGKIFIQFSENGKH